MPFWTPVSIPRQTISFSPRSINKQHAPTKDVAVGIRGPFVITARWREPVTIAHFRRRA
jgi:hypothetical protein